MPLSSGATDVAVIDVGSNSVRLVLYRLEGRAIWTTYNEKVLAGLGRDLGTTGRLHPGGVEQALTALRRFQALIETLSPARVEVAATAAVREATDGPDFVRRAAAETGLHIRVLSGEEEARYSALGVLAGDALAQGAVGDLGGASLELVPLTADGPGAGVTLPFGPFAFSGVFEPDTVRARLRYHLEPLAGAFKSPTFHAVGGAWRNLALLHMRMSDYPLQVVHQYEIGRAEALDSARIIARQSRSSLERIEGVSSKRLETIPHAALVLEQLIEALDVQRVRISAYGLREGLLLDTMDAAVRRRDPLIEGCGGLGARLAGDDILGEALAEWLAPVFSSLPPLMGPREMVLVAAAARLANLGARLHPDHRAELVFEQVLRSPVAGQNHPERAFLAIAAAARHTGSGAPPEVQAVSRILAPDRVRRARALGAALRLGCDLSGRSGALLRRSSLSLENGVLTLAAGPGWADVLLGDRIGRRAGVLAQLLGVRLQVQRG
ncbi:MAG: Ppx/GppA phosphatase [Caulobacteraceae bacterium]|nr:Ppx/GppA phosphatase [Caulobacteraceae bacterium]